jgi:hypothetical protein
MNRVKQLLFSYFWPLILWLLVRVRSVPAVAYTHHNTATIARVNTFTAAIVSITSTSASVVPDITTTAAAFIVHFYMETVPLKVFGAQRYKFWYSVNPYH